MKDSCGIRCTNLGKFWSALLPLFLVCCLVLKTLPADALQAGTVTVEDLSSIGRDEFLDIFGIREGTVFDADTVRLGIKRAFLKGLFEDISVTVSQGEQPDVVIRVHEKDFIRKVVVRGDFQIAEKTIRKHMMLMEDQVMRYDLLEDAAAALARDLAVYGFPGAAVSFSVEKTDRPYRVDLVVAVRTGDPLIIKTVRVAGADTDVVQGANISAGDIYNRVALEEKLQKVRETLKKEGYLNPSVGPYTYENGELTIPVSLGKKVEVSFEGNDALSSNRLLKEITFFQIGIFNDEAVDETVDRMISLYHAEGYPSAQVAPVITADGDMVRVAYFIFEGERIKVGSVVFKGARLPASRLREVISMREHEYFNSDVIERDKDSLREFYTALGFLEMVIKDVDVHIDLEGGLAAITFDIDEGLKTEIALIDIAGGAPDVREKLLSLVRIKTGDPYNEVDISDARYRILDYYSTLGYPQIDVDIRRTVENNKATVIFQVVEGAKKIIGKTIVTGNMQTRYRVIRRELDVKEGEPFNFRTISHIRQRLYKLGLFTDVDVEVIHREKDQNDLLVRLKEAYAGSVEFGLGFAEYERLRGFAEVRYRNLWGMNRQGLIRTELSSLEQRYILQFQEPWFMDRPLPFRAYLLYENRKEINIANGDTRYKLERYTASAGFEKKLTEKFKGELFYELSYVNTTEVQPDVILSKEDAGTLAISSIRPGLVFDTRDNPFNPKKGFLASVSLKVASPVFFSETHFVKLVMYGSAFRGLSRNIVLAVSMRGGVAYGFGDTDELPIVERFFLGGRSTVRGYEQDTLGPKGNDNNPTGGNAFLMTNLELRAAIGKGFGLVPFVDAGSVWIKPGDFSVSDIKYTTGLGLRYDTPVGPLRIDYGIKLNKEARESRGAVHFSIGHAF